MRAFGCWGGWVSAAAGRLFAAAGPIANQDALPVPPHSLSNKTLHSHHQSINESTHRAANVTLSFSYPVELSKLAAALQLLPAKAGDSAVSSKVSVLPCPSQAAAPRPLVMFRAGAPTSAADLLAGNSTCAVVQLSPALPVATGAILRLPKGEGRSDEGLVSASLDFTPFNYCLLPLIVHPLIHARYIQTSSQAPATAKSLAPPAPTST